MADTSARKRELPMLACVFLFWFSMYTYPSFFSTYVSDRLLAPEVMTGVIVGAYGFAQMVLPIPLGIASDLTRKRKPFITLGFCTSLLACLGLVLTELLAAKGALGTLAHIMALIARGLSGVTAATWVSFSVLYSASYEADEIAPAVSRLMVPQYGSQIVAMLLGAQLAQRLGENAAFALGAAAALFGLFLMRRVPDRPPEGERLTLRSFKEVLHDRGLRVGTLLGTLFRLICWGTVLGFVPNWARDMAGFTVSELGFLSVMYLLPNTVMARLSGAYLAPRFGFRAVLTSGFVLVGAACLLYPHALSLWPMMATQALFGVGMGLILPLTLSVSIQNIPDRRRGAAMGVYQAVYGAGVFIGPVAAGWIIASQGTQAAGMALNFRVNAALSLLGALLSLALVHGRGASGQESSKTFT